MISQPSQKVTENGQFEPSTPVLSQYEQRIRVLELTVQLLIVRTSCDDYWAEGFHDAAKVLAAMPLSTVDFTSANLHLQNALGYCQQEEFGCRRV